MQETGSNIINNYSYKCTLVPTQFFQQQEARVLLSETVDLDVSDEVAFVQFPLYDAVLVYAKPQGSVDYFPETYYLLKATEHIGEYNKIVASYTNGRLYLAVVEDKRLLLCNSFEAVDFTTAEYFIFMVLKRFQLNPEMSAIYFRSSLTPEQEMSLYRYFRCVERVD